MRQSPLLFSSSSSSSSSSDHRLHLLPHSASSSFSSSSLLSPSSPSSSSSSPSPSTSSTSALSLWSSSLPWLWLRRPSLKASEYSSPGLRWRSPPSPSSFPAPLSCHPHLTAWLSSRSCCLITAALLVVAALTWLLLQSTSVSCSPSLTSSSSSSRWCRLSSSVLSAAPAPSISASAAAAVSHDDVQLGASFTLACASSSDCPFHSLRHLVVVAGHAVLTSLDYHNLTDDGQWELQSFQRGQLSTFLRHIEEGIAVAATDPTALLLFSGGETRSHAGPRSEAQSYWMVAELRGWFGREQGRDWGEAAGSGDPIAEGVGSDGVWSVRSRSSTEEFARDSYENLLFSICRFHELTQAYPSRITVVGFSFKGPRFAQLHRAAIRFPEDRFAYVGINPSTSTSTSEAVAEQEHLNSFLPFSADPYGCLPPLSTKRLQRNPFRRSHGYGHQSSCPQLHALLHHCGPDAFSHPLPWDDVGGDE